MKKVFYISMAVVLLAVTAFNIAFAYSNVDCVGCATMLFLGMEMSTAILTTWGFRKLYQQFEAGKVDLFKE